MQVMQMQDEEPTEAVAENPSVADVKTESQLAGLNGKPAPHPDDEANTYDPFPLHLERTITAR